MGSKRWSELSGTRRTTITISGVAQVALAAAAWWDLSRRPATAVHGPKTVWAFAIAISYVGPLAYFRFGRQAIDEPAPGLD